MFSRLLKFSLPFSLLSSLFSFSFSFFLSSIFKSQSFCFLIFFPTIVSNRAFIFYCLSNTDFSPIFPSIQGRVDLIIGAGSFYSLVNIFKERLSPPKVFLQANSQHFQDEPQNSKSANAQISRSTCCIVFPHDGLWQSPELRRCIKSLL